MTSCLSILSVIALFVALYVQYENDFAPFDAIYPTESNPIIEQHFSDSYHTARALFRQRAKAVEAELYGLPLGVPDMDLTIDVAVIKGSNKGVLIHVSGTHGVEGFAGSAVQSSLLQNWTMFDQKTSGKTEKPTVIFIHGLNAYGFAQLRRFNENNVDLNRNFLTPKQFRELSSQDPNKYGYVDAYDFFNPTASRHLSNWYWFKAVVQLVQKGYGSLKRAVVSGNYHFPKSIFYGGVKLEKSIELLVTFLKEKLEFKKLEQVGIIDVHTGLGPPGYDTLLIDAYQNFDEVKAIFGTTPEDAKRIAGKNVAKDGVAGGYDAVHGTLCLGLVNLVFKKNPIMCVTQEFGTVPGTFVLKAVSDENAMYQYDPSNRIPYAEKVRDAFYVHRSFRWKKSVIERGDKVFEQLYQHIKNNTCTNRY
jgi:hypothetical protein